MTNQLACPLNHCLLEEEVELSDFEIAGSNLAIWRSDLTLDN